MERTRALKEKATTLEIPSSEGISILEIKQGNSWIKLIATLLLGVCLSYGGIVIASSKGWKISGLVTREIVKEVPVIKTVTKEVPKIIEVPVEKVKVTEKIIEKHVYRDRIMKVPVGVPIEPQRIWIDATHIPPGCYPIFVHLLYENGESRVYKIGMWY